MKTKSVNLADMNEQQLSWMLAKHLFPKDSLVMEPQLGADGSGYCFFGPGEEEEADRIVLNAVEKYKVSSLWRPWAGECGTWWSCVEDNPVDDETLGCESEDRTRAIVMALVAHLEDSKESMTVELPEVLLTAAQRKGV